ncbi:MAG: hypothetical protein IH991_02590, partial [Planctomycetes bacterium]|nr:hypothetical protein [Planctomycetota bacterium]
RGLDRKLIDLLQRLIDCRLTGRALYTSLSPVFVVGQDIADGEDLLANVLNGGLELGDRFSWRWPAEEKFRRAA